MEISNKILSDITVYSKYAKYNQELKRRETWEEIVTRNKEMHIKKYPTLQDEIESVYKLVYDKKILPSMRSLQFGGKSIELSPNRVYNCAYLPIDDYRAFSETMFLLLGGTGVGYSVQKHHVEKLPEIRKPNPLKSTRLYKMK
jgi:ribonucleoside-diphosphate reductase alpha chain